MSRVRIKDVTTIKSWEEADDTMREIAENELMLIDIQSEMNKQIDGIKQIALLEAKPYNDRITALVKDLKLFVEERRLEINGKTKVLNFGKTGFRLATSVKLPTGKDKINNVIKALKAKKMNDCINTKETVNKEILKKYPEDEILMIGARLVKTDDFWYETDKEKLEKI